MSAVLHWNCFVLALDSRDFPLTFIGVRPAIMIDIFVIEATDNFFIPNLFYAEGFRVLTVPRLVKYIIQYK